MTYLGKNRPMIGRFYVLGEACTFI
jgi:hypothetical protein